MARWGNYGAAETRANKAMIDVTKFETISLLEAQLKLTLIFNYKFADGYCISDIIDKYIQKNILKTEK